MLPLQLAPNRSMQAGSRVPGHGLEHDRVVAVAPRRRQVFVCAPVVHPKVASACYCQHAAGYWNRVDGSYAPPKVALCDAVEAVPTPPRVPAEHIALIIKVCLLIIKVLLEGGPDRSSIGSWPPLPTMPDSRAASHTKTS